MKLHDWQAEAVDCYFKADRRSFVANVCPGAGKTHFASVIAGRLLKQQTVRRVVVVVPTNALRKQWADAAAIAGVQLHPELKSDLMKKSGFDGGVVTYAQVAMDPMAHSAACARVPTLAIFDELHHAGERAAWGESIQEAFDSAARHLILTGTLWRPRQDQKIPFVSYPPPHHYAEAHTTYGFARAWTDGVCRPIEFLTWDGEVRWIENGRDIQVRIASDLDDDDSSTALQSAFRLDGEFLPELLRVANQRLDEIRKDVPDAGGLVIAYRMEEARQIAARLSGISGDRVPIAVSDEPEATRTIEEFRSSADKWLVAVSMVSEGVDIPRLHVGVWATRVRTPLFFRQVVGRFVRRRTPTDPNSALFLPALPELKELALEIESEYRQALAEAETMDPREQRIRDGEPEWPGRIVMPGGMAQFDAAILGGKDVGPEYIQAADICAKLGWPASYAGPLAGELARRGMVREAGHDSAPSEPLHKREAILRSELNRRVGQLAFARGGGAAFKELHALIAQTIGAYRDAATVPQLVQAIGLVRRWQDEQRNPK